MTVSNDLKSDLRMNQESHDFSRAECQELIGEEMVMLFIAVDSREDEQVYKTAHNRIK